jgi:hypothetical protein
MGQLMGVGAKRVETVGIPTGVKTQANIFADGPGGIEPDGIVGREVLLPAARLESGGWGVLQGFQLTLALDDGGGEGETGWFEKRANEPHQRDKNQ